MTVHAPASCRPTRHGRRPRCLQRLMAGLSGRPARWGGPARDGGMATAEYAIATLAACGFAGLLIVLMRSDEVRGLLYDVIRRALSLS